MTALEIFSNEFNNCKILPKVIKQNTPYSFIVGGRNGHKSTEIQTFLFLEWLKNKSQFLLIRRRTSHSVNNWFSGHFNAVLSQTDYYIEFVKKIEDTDKYTGYFIIKKRNNEKYNQIFGKVCFLSVEDTYRSNEIKNINNLKYCVYEECIAKTNNKYLIDEPQLLSDTISTFARSKNITVFCIGNTNKGQENNPLFHYYGLNEWDYKQGDLIVDYLYNSHNKATLYLPYNLENNVNYADINGNNVGTSGEWDLPIRYLKTQLNNNFNNLNFELLFRGKKYFLYYNENEDFYYITDEEKYKGDEPNNLNELKIKYGFNILDYDVNIWALLFPKYFDINKNFINLNKQNENIIINMNEGLTQSELIKNNTVSKRKKLYDILTENYYYCSNKALLFVIENNVKNYLKGV